MLYLIKYSKRLLWTTLSLLISLILINTLYYFNIISNNLYRIILVIAIIINIFINTYILGKTASKKGYLEGIKFSFIITTIFLLLTLILKEPINTKTLIYYLIITITSILGSTIGINKKINN